MCEMKENKTSQTKLCMIHTYDKMHFYKYELI